MRDIDLLGLYTLSGKMVPDINMFGPSMKGGVPGERDCAEVVAIDRGRADGWLREVVEKGTKPNGFPRSVCDCHVLGLSTG
jgi:hypothetical protein